ncbi:MAG: hypothetical protein HKN44_00330 [Ilumatobacter sp.]|nr:hypothetical protein [Ilumatobacter sp.]
MPGSDTEHLEVDFSRAKDGLRRYWWLSIVFATLGLGLVLVSASDVTVVEAEFVQSDNRTRLSELITLDGADIVLLRLDTEKFADEVEEELGTPLSYTVTRTDRGLIAIGAEGSNAEEAASNLEQIVGLINRMLRDEEIDVAMERIEILETTIAEVEATIDDIRSDGDSVVSEILERRSLVGLLAAEQHDLTALNAALDAQIDSLVEIRRVERQPTGLTKLLFGFVGGAGIGIAAAVLLGFLRRRVSDEADVRRLTGNGRVMRVSDTTTDADLAAVGLGLLRLRGTGREPASLAPTGARSHSAAEAIVDAAKRTGLPLTLAENGDAPGGFRISLVEHEFGLDRLLLLPDDVVLIVTASVGDQLDDLMALARRLDTAGYESAATLLLS